MQVLSKIRSGLVRLLLRFSELGKQKEKIQAYHYQRQMCCPVCIGCLLYSQRNLVI